MHGHCATIILPYRPFCAIYSRGKTILVCLGGWMHEYAAYPLRLYVFLGSLWQIDFANSIIFRHDLWYQICINPRRAIFKHIHTQVVCVHATFMDKNIKEFDGVALDMWTHDGILFSLKLCYKRSANTNHPRGHPGFDELLFAHRKHLARCVCRLAGCVCMEDEIYFTSNDNTKIHSRDRHTISRREHSLHCCSFYTLGSCWCWLRMSYDQIMASLRPSWILRRQRRLPRIPHVGRQSRYAIEDDDWWFGCVYSYIYIYIYMNSECVFVHNALQ